MHEPTEHEMARDLAADLALLDRYRALNVQCVRQSWEPTLEEKLELADARCCLLYDALPAAIARARWAEDRAARLEQRLEGPDGAYDVLAGQAKENDRLHDRIDELEQALALWCENFLAGPDDRLYRAADRSWWRREESEDRCVLLRADPPDEVQVQAAAADAVRTLAQQVAALGSERNRLVRVLGVIQGQVARALHAGQERRSQAAAGGPAVPEPAAPAGERPADGRIAEAGVAGGATGPAGCGDAAAGSGLAGEGT